MAQRPSAATADSDCFEAAASEKEKLAKTRCKRGEPLCPKMSLIPAIPVPDQLLFSSVSFGGQVCQSKMSIRMNATVNEARAAAGHSKEQWDRFYVSCWGFWR